MFKRRLHKLEEQGLLRGTRARAGAQGPRVNVSGREYLNFASNDYLGLAGDEALREASLKAIRRYGAGSGASRLLLGGCGLHDELEDRAAKFKSAGAALLFNSGYAANTGIIPALAGQGDLILSDALNHASIVDGCRLSRAETKVYAHRDTAALEKLLNEFAPASKEGRALIVTDSVFSMTGDIAPLAEIYSLAREHGALLYVDDAHATGVLGKGRGSLEHFGLKPGNWDGGGGLLIMSTFSKALGSFGAFAAGDQDTIKWLINSARSFIYSTALPPGVVGASLAALNIVESDNTRLARLWANQEALVAALRVLGLKVEGSKTPIIPIAMKNTGDALRVAGALWDAGIYAPAIRPPTVPGAIIRLTVTAAHRGEDIQALAKALGQIL